MDTYYTTHTHSKGLEMSLGSSGDLSSLSLKVLRDMQDGSLAVREKVYRGNFSQIRMRERYMAGNLRLHASVSTGAIANEHKFVVFRRFGSRVELKNRPGRTTINAEIGELDLSGNKRCHKGNAVFVRSGNPSEQAKEIVPTCVSIPSWVGFIGPKGSIEFLGNVSALIFGHCDVEVAGIFPEREVTPPAMFAADLVSSSINGLVESVPEVLHDVRGNASEMDRRRRKDEFEAILAALRIEIFSHSCRIFFDEVRDRTIEIVKLHASP
jgi:hypothetical protein